MPITYNIRVDAATGEAVALGKNGRSYRLDEVAQVEEAARQGDADAAATLAALDHTGMSLEDVMDDCPACRAARAMGFAAPIFSWSAGGRPRRRKRRRGRGRR